MHSYICFAIAYDFNNIQYVTLCKLSTSPLTVNLKMFCIQLAKYSNYTIIVQYTCWSITSHTTSRLNVIKLCNKHRGVLIYLDRQVSSLAIYIVLVLIHGYYI